MGRSLRSIAIWVLVSLVAPILQTPAVASFPSGNGFFAAEYSLSYPTKSRVYDLTGTNRGNLATSLNGADSPSWSADGRMVAYHSIGSFQPATPYDDIWIQEYGTGADPVRVTGSFDQDAFTPSWSPTGNRLTFESEGRIWTIKRDGTGATPITGGPNDSQPEWGPAGRIAFTRNADIWTMGADGSNQVQLTMLGNASAADWSPDATKIAFEAAGEVWVVDSDGANPTNVTNDANRFEQNPSWAPDMTKIAYVDVANGGPLSSQSIWTMDPDGSDKSQVTTDGAHILSVDWQSVDPLPDEVISRLSAEYGDDIYNTTGSGQTLGARIRRGRTAIFDIGVWNDGQVADSFTIRGCASLAGMTVIYRKSGLNVSAQVKQGTYPTGTLDPNESVELSLVLIVKAKAKKGTRVCAVMATSGIAPVLRDTVKARVTVVV